MENNNYVLEEDINLGTVKIADDVVAMIAGLACMEVKGVSAMAGNVGNELLDRVGVKSLPIGEADLEWILHRNCEGTEQLQNNRQQDEVYE